MAVIGVDLGGTKLAGVLLDDDNAVVEQIWAAHTINRDRNAVAVLDAGIVELRRLAETHRLAVRGVGVSIAGWLDRPRHQVVHAANLALTGVPLRAELEFRHRLPVRLGNDGDCTLLGEHTAGAARGSTDVVLLTVGTGVAGAVMTDGRLLVGSRGVAGELGHIPISSAADLCVCGGLGCLEQHVSGAALGRIANRLATRPGSSWLNPTAGPVTARYLGEAARAHSPAARAEIQRAAAALARAVQILRAVVDPEVVVLSGAVIEGLGDLIVPAVTTLVNAAPHPLAAHYAAPRIVVAGLAGIAAAIGAAQLVTHDRQLQ